MTPALVSAANESHIPLLDLAAPTFRQYAEQHHYHCEVIRGYNCDRPASWQKIPIILDLLESFSPVLWVDADAMFARTNRDIREDAIDPYDLWTGGGREIWMTLHRVNYLSWPLLNAGVLVVYNTPRVIDFLYRVYDQAQFTDHPWWEQAAIMHLLGYDLDFRGWAKPGPETEWSPLVGWLGTEWNSMSHDPHPHPYIEHFSGLPLPTRLEEMRKKAGVAA